MQRAELDTERAAVAQERVTYRNGDATLDSLIADFRKFTADRDDELAALLESGDVTPVGAKAIRSWFIKEERLALPAPLPAAEREEAAAAIGPTPTPSSRPARSQALYPGTSLPSSPASSSPTNLSFIFRRPPAADSRATAPARSSWTAPMSMISRIC
jgi:hypothetical protein